jgi:2-amino-4-hydroxy-6-hydroxymethyldihydropteridine diphosphokinase
VVDIDILLYGDLVFETLELTIPHREMHNRAFVLIPLAEIAPEAVDPLSQKSIRALSESVPGRETVILLGRLST